MNRGRERKEKKMWLKLFGSVIALVGVVCIFEGRQIVKKYFNFGEENLATAGMKLLGFLVTVVGGFMMME